MKIKGIQLVIEELELIGLFQYNDEDRERYHFQGNGLKLGISFVYVDGVLYCESELYDEVGLVKDSFKKSDDFLKEVGVFVVMRSMKARKKAVCKERVVSLDSF